jgi:5-methylcytosine-specific restriction endonuclease McrA
MEHCCHGDRAIDPNIIHSGIGQVPDEIGTVDHIIPLSAEGSPGHVWDNVRAAHRLCNREAFSPSSDPSPN